jgi:hypothetical protein
MSDNRARAMVPLALLRDANWNPPNRISKTAIKSLADSMEKIGLLHPVTITKERMIIEGHRRVAAAKWLKWKDIECNIVQGDPAEIYASVNSTPRKMAGNDALGVWLKEPHAVLESTNKNFSMIESMVGRELLQEVFAGGFSMRLIRTARKICRYCDMDSDETLQKVIKWFLKFPVAGLAMKAMDNGVDPKTIMQAVDRSKPIKLKIAM